MSLSTKYPTTRKLRGYAFDPSLSLDMNTSAINDVTYRVRWEFVTSGPTGEYVEVVDYDPSLKVFYTPVELNSLAIVASDGLNPSESNPQFHQQMVYAVAMTTIANFEKALGRKLLWAPHYKLMNQRLKEEYVHRLRIYPHALREANAYYSPLKKALLFGYFAAEPANETLQMPNSLVFTCLSHDIIAHEITHAILDGMHRNYNEATNPDVLAFHEAFADIVALFQHFSFPEVLKHQISQTRGDLRSENLLAKLAQQFGTSIGNYGSLRDAIGRYDKDTGTWIQVKPDPADYREVMEPHQRGSILVAAVFEAFLAIYRVRTADLLRIASGGSGILPAGELHPDLVNRLAIEAAKASGHVLTMCVRALDYCPPVDITFGDFLRGIITADIELVAEDDKNYRLAFIDAFRRRGIYPAGIKTLSVESLQYEPYDFEFNQAGEMKDRPDSQLLDDEMKDLLVILAKFFREYESQIKYIGDRSEIFRITNDYVHGNWADGEQRINGLQRRISVKFPYSRGFSKITGLAFLNEFQNLGVKSASLGNYHGPEFEIQNLRLVNRTGPNGEQVNQVIFSIIQAAEGYFNGSKFSRTLVDNFRVEDKFAIKGGCTMIFDLDALQLKFAIAKPIIDVALLSAGQVSLDFNRLRAIQSFHDMALNSQNMQGYFQDEHVINEPFALLHQN